MAQDNIELDKSATTFVINVQEKNEDSFKQHNGKPGIQISNRNSLDLNYNFTGTEQMTCEKFPKRKNSRQKRITNKLVLRPKLPIFKK